MRLENYRHYIQSEFEHRRLRNPSYSLRAFARDLKTSPSRLSEAINGKRGISTALARQIVKILDLGGVDAEIFLWSVEAEHSRSAKQRALAQQKLGQTLATSEIAVKTFTMVDWVADALLKMNERESVVGSLERAAKLLDVPRFMVTDSMRFLTRLGFVAGEKGFKTYLQSRGKGRKLNIDYTQILDQALKAYIGSSSENFFNYEAFLLEKKQTEKANRILRGALDEIRKLETKSKNSKVVFIANQIFSVETGRKQK